MRSSLAVALLALLAPPVCTHVTSGQPGATVVTEDAWYVKTTRILGIPTNTEVYYCPKPIKDQGEGKRRMRCRRADLID